MLLSLISISLLTNFINSHTCRPIWRPSFSCFILFSIFFVAQLQRPDFDGSLHSYSVAAAAGAAWINAVSIRKPLSQRLLNRLLLFCSFLAESSRKELLNQIVHPYKHTYIDTFCTYHICSVLLCCVQLQQKLSMQQRKWTLYTFREPTSACGY